MLRFHFGNCKDPVYLHVMNGKKMVYKANYWKQVVLPHSLLVCFVAQISDFELFPCQELFSVISQPSISFLIVYPWFPYVFLCARLTAQISKSVRLEAGKYYYIIALEKGTESTDSLSAGVRLPSGRFMRPISKETLQWRLPGESWRIAIDLLPR